jgi:hypothetical protein
MLPFGIRSDMLGGLPLPPGGGVPFAPGAPLGGGTAPGAAADWPV